MVVMLRAMFNILASSLLHPRSLTVLDTTTGRVVGHLSRKELASYPALRTTDIEGVRRYLKGLPVAPESEVIRVLVEEGELKIFGDNLDEGVPYPVRYQRHTYFVQKNKDGVLGLYELGG